jgi:hypothetical protein
MDTLEDLAERFVMDVVEGRPTLSDPEDARREAEHHVLRAARFQTRDDRAEAWLRSLVTTMPRGSFETEVEHVVKAVQSRQHAWPGARRGDPV